MKRILMVGSEATPFAKTGGLGDVLGALPAALTRLGLPVCVILPRYRSTAVSSAEPFGKPFLVHPGWMNFQVQLWKQSAADTNLGADFYLVDCPDLYNREGIYGDVTGDFGDNHIRYSALCHAAVELARRLGDVGVLHLHDWQAALTAAYVRVYFGREFSKIPIVFTIHNLGYQGVFSRGALTEVGLPSWTFRPDLVEYHGSLNLMKAGLVYADHITTVSPTYAREIQTLVFGEGLDGLLRARANAVTGILNGCDYETWDPATDKLIPAHYKAKNLAGKATCKQALLGEFGLPASEDPVIGIVSRLANQKGFELLAEITPRLMELPIKLVVLGAGDAAIEKMFRALAAAHPDKVAVRIGYNEHLAHLIEAGSDMFLMPSRYEPCGLNQMYSLRYGTLPIVRATGGLEDTVNDETGFKFWGFTGEELFRCIQFALDVWTNDPKLWRRMVRTAMGRDYSWDTSAAQYVQLYQRLEAARTPVD